MKTNKPQTQRVRNHGWLPFLLTEGIYRQLPPGPAPTKTPDIWYKGLKPHERLNYHQTLSSTRHTFLFQQLRAPKDALDGKLTSSYKHNAELFPDRADVILQPDTTCNENDLAPICELDCDNITEMPWRRLKNTKENPKKVIIPRGHPIKYGGISERISTFQPKIMCSSNHLPTTNPGYSRQPADGTMYYY